MRQQSMTTCIKCGKPIVIPKRQQAPYEHPLQKIVKQLVPQLCATCKMRQKLPRRLM